MIIESWLDHLTVKTKAIQLHTQRVLLNRLVALVWLVEPGLGIRLLAGSHELFNVTDVLRLLLSFGVY